MKNRPVVCLSCGTVSIQRTDLTRRMSRFCPVCLAETEHALAHFNALIRQEVARHAR